VNSDSRAARLLRYACAGSGGTALQYLALVALAQSGQMRPEAAAVLAAASGALANYILNRRFIFDAAPAHAVALPRFLAVAAASALASATLVGVAGALGIHYLAGQALATALVLLSGFELNRRWTFHSA